MTWYTEGDREELRTREKGHVMCLAHVCDAKDTGSAETEGHSRTADLDISSEYDTI